MSDSAFKALADPTRREILRLLAGGDLAAGELGARFDISQPAVSRHLAVLRAAGLVSARREGQSVVYALDTTVVQDVVRLLLDLAPRGKAKGGAPR
jgi:DNA-binding transcriptional ArsR family regulator